MIPLTRTLKPNTANSFSSKVLTLAFTGIVAAACAVPAWSGTFSVTPVRLYFKPQDRAIAVTVTNDGDEELIMQVDIYAWKQKPNGEDDLVLTEDLILSPPIVKVAPKSRQVVRLAKLSVALGGEQRTYRMIAREVPEAKPSNRNLQLQIALAFSMPVFITPPGAKYKLDCALEWATADTLRVVCENVGNAYAQLREFAVNSASGQKLAGLEGGAYLLPGIKRSFEIKKTGSGLPGGKVKMLVTLDDAVQTFDLTIP